MRSHPVTPGRPSAVTTLLTTAAALALAVPPATAEPAGGPLRTVEHLGYRVQVPAHWPVVDLAAHPDTCVRFDRPAVYLGHPGDQSSCPRRLVGRRAGLVIQPLDRRALDPLATAPATAVPGTAIPPAGSGPHHPSWADGAFELAVPGAGVLVTAVHGGDDARLAHAALRGATLTDRARPAAAPDRVRRATPTAVGAQPGTYHGKGFDTCGAPSSAVMDAWLSSPYRSVGVYTSGSFRACAQPNLTPDWVSRQTGKGWRLTPIHVGLQAPCSKYSKKMSADSATARSQGVSAANEAVAAAQRLGIPAGSSIFLDIEQYAPGGACGTAVVAHTSGWTERLHQHGYLSGFYSSGGGGIADMKNHHGSTRYALPDQLWIAWWNGKANTDVGAYLRAGQWVNSQRIKQYTGDTKETNGGVRLHIDRNFLDLKAGSPPKPDPCTGTGLDFANYPNLTRGSNGDRVKAVQCLLRAGGQLPGSGAPSGNFDEATAKATSAFQAKVGLRQSGEVDAHTWTALLSAGAAPLLQSGASGEAVTRVQRALTAALGRSVGIDGQFGPGTKGAVEQYQQSRALGVDGAVGPKTWQALQAGK